MIINVKSDLDRLRLQLQGEQKQMRTSAAIALTRTAKSAQAKLKDEMRRVFDRPVPYTLNATYVRSATTARLEATVGLKDEAGKGTPAFNYLGPQIYGGERKDKRMERALRMVVRGHLPIGMQIVPAAGAKMDSNGNMSRGQVMQILSALGAAETFGGRTANRTARSAKRNKKQAEYFVGRPGGGRLPLGIWQRFRFGFGSAVKPVMLFVKRVNYKPRMRFTDLVAETHVAEFDQHFNAALKEQQERAVAA